LGKKGSKFVELIEQYTHRNDPKQSDNEFQFKYSTVEDISRIISTVNKLPVRIQRAKISELLNESHENENLNHVKQEYLLANKNSKFKKESS
jgi:hypothetical protein